jgi:hypothetical protein
MGDEPFGERLVRLETQMMTFLEAQKQRSTREWAIIMVGIGLILSIAAKNLGWVK